MRTFEEVMKFTSTVSSDLALSDEEASLLYDCCSQVPLGCRVVEIGCQLGRSSTLIAQLAQDNGFHPIHIDPHTRQPEYAKGWIQSMLDVQGHDEHEFTALYMRTEQASWILPRLSPFRLAYIDGDHEYPGVKKDLLWVANFVETDGFLLAHDYRRDSLPGVTRAIDEYISDKWEPIGVRGTMGAWRRK